MIVIPLAGESSRFFDQGYKEFKFFLPLNHQSVIENIVRWIPKTEAVLFVVHEKHRIVERLRNLFVNSGNEIFYVSVQSTSGQLDTVEKGVREALKMGYVALSEPLIVFNGDTIRKKAFEFQGYGEWWLETFIGEGTHWSFADKIGVVSQITEKIRISNHCSDGLYSLSFVGSFLEEVRSYWVEDGEKYVAPFLNYIISKGFTVRAFDIDTKLLDFCGTPSEFEKTKLRY